MKNIIWFLIIAILFLCTTMVFADSTPTARAGKYTVALTCRPSPPVVGENLLVITVQDGDKPLTDAGITLHLDMTDMPMPANAIANPGSIAGEYGAIVNFSMAGTWKIDVTVRQMAAMKMAGDGTAQFQLATGKGITALGTGGGISLGMQLVLVLLAICIATVICYKRIPLKARGYLVGTLTLLVVLAGTSIIVQKYRDPNTSTVIASAMMDMSTQAAPGTVAVLTEVVAQSPFQAGASYTGTVAPDQEEDVYPRVTGRLISLPYYAGDYIAAGKLVATLDSSELSAKQQQAKFGDAQANQGIIAANAEKDAARAALGKAERARQQTSAQLTQAQAAVRAADSAIASAQSGVEQANEAVIEAQSDVDTAQADVTYWNAEIMREQKLYALGAIAKEELERETSQAATASAKLKQTQAGVRAAQIGVTRASRELDRAAADRDGATGRVTEMQAAILAADADIQAAQASIAGASARADMATASAGQARALLTEATTIKGYTEIHTSFGGVVTARNISPGTLVQPGMSIMKIAKTDIMRIQVNVSEADLTNVAIGQTITAYAIAARNQPINARISAIFPTQDPSARTAIVEARVVNSDHRLRPGQYLSVTLSLESNAQPALSVPTSAVLTRDGQSSVFLAISDGLRLTAKRVAVTSGRMNNTRTEILTGVKVGDQVITSGLADLHDGDALTVLAGEPSPSPPIIGATDAPVPSNTPKDTPAMHDKVHRRTSSQQHPPATTRMSQTGHRDKSQHNMEASKTGQPTDDKTKWYHCPMHVNMESNQPGKCPICGMDYVQFEKK